MFVVSTMASDIRRAHRLAIANRLAGSARPTRDFVSASSWRGACLSPQAMTLKIEIASDGETATFRLCGQIDQDHLVELQAEVRRYRPRLVFDLAETTLVDLAAVGFLAAHVGGGVGWLGCPRFNPGWFPRERGARAPEPCTAA